MSEVLRAEMPAITMLDPDRTDAFSKEIRETIDRIIDGRYDFDLLTTLEKVQIRQALLEVSITLKPDGEIVHD